MFADKNIYCSYIRTALLFFVCALPIAGCGSSLYTAFLADPLVAGKTFSSRSRPAKIAATQESDLLADGYMMIGTIVIRRQDDGSKGADLTSLALIEAAKHGGDSVIFKSNNIRTSEIRYKNGGCLEQEDYKEKYWEAGGTYCDNNDICYVPYGFETVHECKKWEQIPYTVFFTEAEVKVFRHVSTK